MTLILLIGNEKKNYFPRLSQLGFFIFALDS